MVYGCVCVLQGLGHAKHVGYIVLVLRVDNVTIPGPRLHGGQIVDPLAGTGSGTLRCFRGHLAAAGASHDQCHEHTVFIHGEWFGVGSRCLLHMWTSMTAVHDANAPVKLPYPASLRYVAPVHFAPPVPQTSKSKPQLAQFMFILSAVPVQRQQQNNIAAVQRRLGSKLHLTNSTCSWKKSCMAHLHVEVPDPQHIAVHNHHIVAQARHVLHSPELQGLLEQPTKGAATPSSAECL